MSPNAEQGHKTRQQILEKAAEEIYQHGVSDTSLSQIVKSVGLSKGAFYHHFPTKKSLVESVIQHCVSKHIDSFWLEPLKKYCTESLHN